MENNLYLVFVLPINGGRKNIREKYEYDLYFSETPDVVWGLDWELNNPSSISEDLLDIAPEKSTYQKVIRFESELPFKTIEEMSCYSMEYAISGINALAWIDISNLDEYPEDTGRCVLHFNDDLEKVKNILTKPKITIFLD